MSIKELPTDRLSSTDEQGKRVFFYPADVKGPYKNWRKRVHAVLMIVFLVLPWIKINGHQALLMDLAERRFAIFGLTFWAHDAPMLIFVFGSVLLGISLITALWGRLWCGWACPETVFVESVYRQVERWIEGNAVQRKRLAAGPWTFKKIGLRTAKWSAFLGITLILTHSFMAYFVGTEKLAEMVTHNPAENPGTFVFMASTTAILLFAFGWFREQFCVILCPYGRFQSILMDEDSITVAYDEVRGEPRRARDVPKDQQGDCISCYRCVDVCPTGIDIRRGSQMECIGCTACIDACNEVMLNIHKPTGLIRYTSYNAMVEKKPTRFIRARVIILSVALMGIVSGLIFTLLTRPPVKTTVFNAKTTPFQVLDASAADPVLSNQFYLVASNYTFEHGSVRISASHPQVEVISQTNPFGLDAGEEKKVGVFLKFPKSILKQGTARIELQMQTQADNGRWERVVSQEVPLAGPF